MPKQRRNEVNKDVVFPVSPTERNMTIIERRRSARRACPLKRFVALPATSRAGPEEEPATKKKASHKKAASAAPKPKPPLDAMPDLRAGDIVEARYAATQEGIFRRRKWYEGTVVCVLSTGYVTVFYDDGETEDEVDPKFIKLLERARAAPSPVGGAEERESEEEEEPLSLSDVDDEAAASTLAGLASSPTIHQRSPHNSIKIKNWVISLDHTQPTTLVKTMWPFLANNLVGDDDTFDLPGGASYYIHKAQAPSSDGSYLVYAEEKMD